MPSFPKWGSSFSPKKAEGLAVTKPSSIVPPAKSVASSSQAPYGASPSTGMGPYGGSPPSGSSVQPAGATMSYNPNSPANNYVAPATTPTAGAAGGAAPASYPATPQAFSYPTAPGTAQPPANYSAPPATSAPGGNNFQVGPYGSASVTPPANTAPNSGYAAADSGQTRTTYGQPYTATSTGQPAYGASPAGAIYGSADPNANAGVYAAAPIETASSTTGSNGPTAPAGYQQPPVSEGSMVQPAAPTGTMATRNPLPPSLTAPIGTYRPGSTGMSTPAPGTYPGTTGGTMYR